jgi:phage terminase Nu1 subunit (DNA packaging protein)
MNINTAKLAEILNLSRQRINQLTASKVLNQITKGRYDQNEAITAYINFIRRDHDEPRADGLPSLRESQAKKMAMDAELSETKLAAVRAESITLAEIRARDEKIKIAVHRGLARLPDIAPDLAGRHPAAMKNILTDCCRGILEELADGQSELWK